MAANFESCLDMGCDTRRSTSSSNVVPAIWGNSLLLLFLLLSGLDGALRVPPISSSISMKLLNASEPPLFLQVVFKSCCRVRSRWGELPFDADVLRGFSRDPEGGVSGRMGCELLRVYREDPDTL